MKKARLKVVYEGNDISEDISKYLITFDYNDNLTDRADDISISLDNSSGIWINEWYPKKGSTLDIFLLLDYDEKLSEVHFGKFNIDEFDVSFKPDIFTIKAITSLVEGKFKDEKISKARSNISIKELVNEIANKHGFKAEYKAKTNYVIKWVLQNDQSDANFLYNQLSKYSLTFKINDKRIIVYENAVVGATVEVLDFSSLSFRERTREIYSSATVEYSNPKKNEAIKYTYTDKKIKTGKELKIKEHAESIAEAELIAKAKLEAENKRAVTGSLSMLGIGEIFSGQKIKLKDVGVYSGEYKIEKVNHKLSRSGYINTVEFISL